MKVGVIGCGFWGRKHVEEYASMPGVEVELVVDPSREAQDAALELGAKEASSDLVDAVLADLDAVSVCVDNPNHHPVAKRLLLAGVPVLVEKPLTLSYETSQDLVHTADKMGVLLAVGHVFRYNAGVNELRRRIRAGDFGELHRILARWTTLCPPFPDRGVVSDLAPHSFDILNHLTGEWPTEVFCTGRAYRRQDLEETASITAEYPGGWTGSIEASWLEPGKTREVKVVGVDGSARLDALSQSLTVDGEPVTVEPNNTIRDELQAFLESVKHQRAPSNNGRVGRDVVKCLDACMDSMQRKKAVGVSW